MLISDAGRVQACGMFLSEGGFIKRTQSIKVGFIKSQKGWNREPIRPFVLG